MSTTRGSAIFQLLLHARDFCYVQLFAKMPLRWSKHVHVLRIGKFTQRSLTAVLYTCLSSATNVCDLALIFRDEVPGEWKLTVSQELPETQLRWTNLFPFCDRRFRTTANAFLFPHFAERVFLFFGTSFQRFLGVCLCLLRSPKICSNLARSHSSTWLAMNKLNDASTARKPLSTGRFGFFQLAAIHHWPIQDQPDHSACERRGDKYIEQHRQLWTGDLLFACINSHLFQSHQQWVQSFFELAHSFGIYMFFAARGRNKTKVKCWCVSDACLVATKTRKLVVKHFHIALWTGKLVNWSVCR